MELQKGFFQKNILAISIGLVYLWFGTLKFFPGISPAEELAKNTIDALTFGAIPSDVSIILLACWETIIGVFLIVNLYRRIVVYFAFAHILLTFTPLFFFPEISFEFLPVGLSLIGQYIIKNIIIIGALFTIYMESPTLVHFKQNG